MVPVVFLVLPVTVLFAFWPGVVGLSPDHAMTPREEDDMHAPDLLITRWLRRPRRGPRRDERGDVPGWVLVTVMTAGLVTVLWGVAGDAAERHAAQRARLGRAEARCAARRRAERGAAVVDFVLVLVVLVPLFLGILQVALVLLVRNTLTSAASEGARYAATLDRGPADGAAADPRSRSTARSPAGSPATSMRRRDRSTARPAVEVDRARGGARRSGSAARRRPSTSPATPSRSAP